MPFYVNLSRQLRWATIHQAHCTFARYAKRATARWLGPYETAAEAAGAAQMQGLRGTPCSFCMRAEGKPLRLPFLFASLGGPMVS